MIRKVKYALVLVIVAVGIYITMILLFNGENVRLYFATKDGLYLAEETRKIKGDKIEGALLELINGPHKSTLSPTIPKGVEVLNIKVVNQQAIVNFSEKLVRDHWGGSTGELLTIYSIVNTLCQFNGIDRVQILIEGRKIETLAGHFVIEESLLANFELVR